MVDNKYMKNCELSSYCGQEEENEGIQKKH